MTGEGFDYTEVPTSERIPLICVPRKNQGDDCDDRNEGEDQSVLGEALTIAIDTANLRTNPVLDLRLPRWNGRRAV